MFQKFIKSVLFVLILVLAAGQGGFAQQLFEVRHFAGSPGGPGTRDGIGADARFHGPNAVWGDGTYLYVGDSSTIGSTIRRVTLSTGEVRLIAGSLAAYGSTDGVGTNALLGAISGLWGDGTYLYIADSSNARVRRMTLATTEVVTIAGTRSGAPVDGPAANAVFRGPLGIWGSGRYLFVTDNGYLPLSGGPIVPAPPMAGTLRRIDLVTNTVTTIPLPATQAFTPASLAGNSTDLFVALSGQVYSMDLGTRAFQLVATFPESPAGLWSGDDGFLYGSALSGDEILRADPATHNIEAIFGAAKQHDWIDGAGTHARLRTPRGLWGSGSKLYIADNGNYVIRSADLSSLQMTTLAGTGVHIADQAQDPGTPAGVNWSDGAYLYFGTARDQVWRMPIGGGPATLFAGTTVTGYADGPAATAQFTYITGIWGDGAFLYVIDGYGDRIRKVYLSDGNVTTLVSGAGQFPFRTFVSNSIWGDGRSLYVSGSTTIFKVEAASGSMQVLAGVPQVTGSANGAGPIATFNGPAGLWGDGTYLYIADNNNCLIRRLTLATNEVTTLAGQTSVRNVVDGVGTSAAFNYPRNLWGDGTNLYITDMYGVRRLKIATDEVVTIAGSLAGGLNQPIDGIGAGARFASAGTIWGKGGLLYIEDMYRVRTVDVNTGEVVTIAGLPTIVADGIGMDARFNQPAGIWGDSTYLYVTDQANHVLRRINRATAEVQTVAGVAGQSGVLDGAGARARFNSPTAICSDGTSLYVADTGNHAIRKVTPGTWQVTTFSGTLGVFGDPAAGQYRNPSGLWCDKDYVYVSDNRAIRRITIATGELQILLSGHSPLSDLIGTSPLWSDGQFLYFSSSVGTVTGLNKLDLSTLQVTQISSQVLPSYGNIWGDAHGLYVTPVFSLTPNPSILRLDLSTGAISTIAGSSQFIGSEDGIGTDGRFNLPVGLWSDGSTMYVADLGNNAIRSIVLSTVPPPVSTLTFSASAAGSVSRTTVETGGSVQVGYARIQRSSASAPVAGMAIYGLRVNGVLVSETGVPAVPAIRRGRLYAEAAGNVRTGFAMANPNADDVTLSFYFTDASGQNFNAGSMTLGANQQIAAFLDQQPFSPAVSQRPLADARTFTFSASEPVAAITLRGFVNERGDFLMTTLPIADLSTPSSGMAVIPHFVEGSGWTSQIELVNPSDTTMTGNLVFFDQTGTQIDTRAYSIAPRSSAVVQSNSAVAGMRAGSIHVNPDSGQQTPVASNIFSYAEPGITITETGARAVDPASSLMLYGEDSASLRSGFAFANPSSQRINVHYDVFSSDGSAIGMSGSLDIPANAQRALFLDELPGASALPAEFKGVIQLTTTGGPISAIGLRVRTNERGETILSTTMPDSGSVPADELYVPHFVSGGGFTTEFILMSPGAMATAPISGSMGFYSPAGQALPLPLN